MPRNGPCKRCSVCNKFYIPTADTVILQHMGNVLRVTINTPALAGFLHIRISLSIFFRVHAVVVVPYPGDVSRSVIVSLQGNFDVIHVIGICYSCHLQTRPHIAYAHADRIFHRCHRTKIHLHHICSDTTGFLHHDGFDQSNISADSIIIGVLRDQVAVLQYSIADSRCTCAGILPFSFFFAGLASGNTHQKRYRH